MHGRWAARTPLHMTVTSTGSSLVYAVAGPGIIIYNNNNRYRIACYSIELNASVDYMKPSFAIKSMNHCIFNRELDTG